MKVGIITNAAEWRSRRLQGKLVYQGLPISIENERGSYRQGNAPDGTFWRTFMHYAYGYIRATEGTDGDHVDCYVGPNQFADTVYVVHQQDPDTKRYDEDKCMLGFNSAAEAKSAYLRQYDRPGFFQSMSEYPMGTFKALLRAREGMKLKKSITVLQPSELLKAKALPIGTISHGKKKVARGEWQWVKQARNLVVATDKNLVVKLTDKSNEKRIDKSKLVQPTGRLKELYQKVGAEHKNFKSFVDTSAEHLGATNVLMRSGFKRRDRVRAKIKEDGAPDARQIYDIDGATLVFSDVKDVAKALEYFMRQPNVVRIKNNFANPTPAGYRDININVKGKNGTISEIQLSTLPMMVVKKAVGHPMYAVTRESLGHTPPPPPPGPYAELLEAQKMAYSYAWEESQRPSADANLVASVLDIIRPLWNKSAKIIEEQDSSWLSDKTRESFMELGSQANGTSSLS